MSLAPTPIHLRYIISIYTTYTTELLFIFCYVLFTIFACLIYPLFGSLPLFHYSPLTALSTSSLMPSRVPKLESSCGISLFCSHPPHAYWKKSSHGSAVASIFSIIRAAGNRGEERGECKRQSVPIRRMVLHFGLDRHKPRLLEFDFCRREYIGHLRSHRLFCVHSISNDFMLHLYLFGIWGF